MDALLFVPVAIAISLTPGPNNFCGLNNGIRAGVGAAMIATVGRAAAFAIFLTVSAVGLGAMLLASEAAFTAVKWVGAAYLFWLGWRAWRSREFSGLALEDVPGTGPQPGRSAPVNLRALIAQEFLLGITNPKAIILFAAIFPQFIDPAQPAARQFLVLQDQALRTRFDDAARDAEQALGRMSVSGAMTDDVLAWRGQLGRIRGQLRQPEAASAADATLADAFRNLDDLNRRLNLQTRLLIEGQSDHLLTGLEKGRERFARHVLIAFLVSILLALGLGLWLARPLKRLERAEAYEVDDPRLVTIVNDATIDDAASSFVRLLSRLGWPDAALRRA